LAELARPRLQNINRSHMLLRAKRNTCQAATRRSPAPPAVSCSLLGVVRHRTAWRCIASHQRKRKQAGSDLPDEFYFYLVVVDKKSTVCPVQYACCSVLDLVPCCGMSLISQRKRTGNRTSVGTRDVKCGSRDALLIVTSLAVRWQFTDCSPSFVHG
jgi:hypothetical protein